MSLGTPFLVDSGTNAVRSGPLVAGSSNGSSVFVWNQAYKSINQIYAQRFNVAGAKVGPEVLVSAGSITAGSVAMDAQGDFVVACALTDSSNHTDILALSLSGKPRSRSVPSSNIGDRDNPGATS
jgi:hypothetical protein